MKKIVMAVLIAVAVIFTAAYAFAAETEVFGKVGYVDWKEHLSRKRVFTQETGQVYSLGIVDTFHPSDYVFTQFSVEGFAGSLDYSGYDMTTLPFTPMETKTTRIGATAELTGGLNANIYSDVYIKPFVTLGYSGWGRSVSGEIWQTGYAKPGVEIRNGRFFAKAGLIIPGFTRVKYSWEGVDGPETKTTREENLKNTNTYFWEVGLGVSQVNFTLSYELRKWESLGCQPDTEQNLTSFKVGILF